LTPVTRGGSAGAAAELQIMFLILALGLVAALVFGISLYRRWRAARFEMAGENDWVPSSVIAEGNPATLESPSVTGIVASKSMVRSTHKRWIGLSSPDETGSPLAIGTPVAVLARGESCLYRFHGAVVDRRVVDGVATLFVEKPPIIEKVQRRENFRVAVELPTTLSVLESGSDDSPPMRATIDNLSGGGFRVAIDKPLPEGSIVRVRIPVVTRMGFSFEARVVRCAAVRTVGPLRHRAQCEFIHLPEETRNLIVACCFDFQRQLRAG
jgi:c-di-GMP-binding flagellar brake protein YcgR